MSKKILLWRVFSWVKIDNLVQSQTRQNKKAEDCITLILQEEMAYLHILKAVTEQYLNKKK